MDNATLATGGNAIPVELATRIVKSYVRNNTLTAALLPGLIVEVHAALMRLAEPSASATEEVVKKLTPAQIKKSITSDALISFLDGKPYKTLKRHLKAHQLDPDGYRARYGLPSNYPMTAPSYSERRSALAKASGLGQQRRTWPAKGA